MHKVTMWRRRLKATLVAEAGGKCVRCGYDRCVAALHFHHRNPDEKSFGVSASGLTRSATSVREEVKKCDLLCANCHAEVEVELPRKLNGERLPVKEKEDGSIPSCGVTVTE